MSIRDRITEKLTAGFQPQHLEVIDESHRHAGHAGVRHGDGHAPHTGETHFHVEIVSAAFVGQSRVARQRAIYDLLAAEFKDGVHALSLRTQTPDEATRSAGG